MPLSSALPFAPGAILLALVTIQIAQPGGLGGGGRKSKPGQKTAGMGGSKFTPSSSRRWGAGAHSPGMGAATSGTMNRNRYSPPSATAIPRSGHHLPDMRTIAARGPAKLKTQNSFTASQHRKGPGAKKKGSQKGAQSVTAQGAEFAMGFLNHDSTTNAAQNRGGIWRRMSYCRSMRDLVIIMSMDYGCRNLRIYDYRLYMNIFMSCKVISLSTGRSYRYLVCKNCEDI
ncbi:hypothetical protein DFH27DRAFT_116800 [Peziza echinospora]|nr:hypothetical protein DFH27DRAFT_116800 [Peziza echinospora]